MIKFFYIILFSLVSITSFGQFQNNSPRIFNVLLFGAKGDGVTDDTGPIQAAINAAAKVSGTVYFPYTKHHYIVAGPILTNDGQGDSVNNAQLYIPYITLANRAQMGTINIIGENAPNVYTDYSAVISQVPDSTVIIESTSTASSGAVFGGAYLNGTWGNFTYLQANFQNLCIRVHSKTGASHIAPKLTAIDALVISMFSARHVRIDTQSPQDSSAAPASTAYGIKTPALNNFAYVELEDILIQNYYCGILVNEHTNTRGAITVATCHYGIQTQAGYHASNFNRLLLIWNIDNILLGPASIGQITNVNELDLEDYPGFTASGGLVPDRWFNTTMDIKDSSGGGARGVFQYRRVIAASGGDDGNIITNGIGGSGNINVQVTPIGYPPHIFNDGFTTGVSTTLEVAGVGQYTGIFFNQGHAGGNGGNVIQFQKGGIPKLQIGHDFLAANVNDFYMYDYSHSRLFQYYTSGGVNQFGGSDASSAPLFTVSNTAVTLPVLTATALDTTNYKLVVRKSSDNSLAVMNWPNPVVSETTNQYTVKSTISALGISDTLTLPKAKDTNTIYEATIHTYGVNGGTDPSNFDTWNIIFKAGSGGGLQNNFETYNQTPVNGGAGITTKVYIFYSTLHGWVMTTSAIIMVGVGNSPTVNPWSSFNNIAISGSFDPTVTAPTLWLTYAQGTSSSTKYGVFESMYVETKHKP